MGNFWFTLSFSYLGIKSMKHRYMSRTRNIGDLSLPFLVSVEGSFVNVKKLWKLRYGSLFYAVPKFLPRWRSSEIFNRWIFSELQRESRIKKRKIGKKNVRARWIFDSFDNRSIEWECLTEKKEIMKKEREMEREKVWYNVVISMMKIGR